MSAYILRRLMLIPLTLLGVMLLNFIIIQAAPGGPVERMVAQLTSLDANRGASATARISGSGSDLGGRQQTGMTSGTDSAYLGARGLDPELVADLEKLYGFDKPPAERFIQMLTSYIRLDFGESFYRDRSVLALIADTLPVTISLGLWTTLLVYGISIPLGIRKAMRDGSAFDSWTSVAIIIGYAIPSFLFAILLIILFAGGNYFQWFPLRGLTSAGFETMGWGEKILDYLWHITLPVAAMVLSGFASLTMLTKNCFLDEIHKLYVTAARARGVGERRVLYGHVFRNAMLIVIAGFPSALLRILFTSALLIEIIFSLNGLGLLGYEAIIGRDYPVVFGSLFIFTLLGLVFSLLGDIAYMLIDPRIDFERR